METTPKRQEEIINIRRAFLSGVKQAQLAREYKVSREMIRQIVRYLAYKDVAPELRDACREKIAERNMIFSEEGLKELREAYRAGATLESLAEKHQCTLSTVKSALRGDSNYTRNEDAILNIPKRVRSGDNHPMSKLSEALVREMKQRAANGESAVTLSKAYGITYHHTRRILSGDMWRNA